MSQDLEMSFRIRTVPRGDLSAVLRKPLREKRMCESVGVSRTVSIRGRVVTALIAIAEPEFTEVLFNAVT
jgi:hypothetical protein